MKYFICMILFQWRGVCLCYESKFLFQKVTRYKSQSQD